MAKAAPQYVRAVRLLKCDACEEEKDRPQTTKTTLPRDCMFNRDVGLDILEVKDATGTRFSCLNMVHMGTTCRQAILLHEGGSQASGQACLDVFVDRWVGWAAEAPSVGQTLEPQWLRS